MVSTLLLLSWSRHVSNQSLSYVNPYSIGALGILQKSGVGLADTCPTPWYCPVLPRRIKYAVFEGTLMVVTSVGDVLTFTP
jgi:hypothetical protein